MYKNNILNIYLVTFSNKSRKVYNIKIPQNVCKTGYLLANIYLLLDFLIECYRPVIMLLFISYLDGTIYE